MLKVVLLLGLLIAWYLHRKEYKGASAAALVVGACLLIGGAVFIPKSDACAWGGGCGLKPLKPLTPLGCRDLVPICECDSSGSNCAWRWVCVK